MNGNDDIDNERSGLISNAATASQSAIPEVPLCGFLTVQYYQPFFDVDTVDISNRILASTFFCRREQNFVTMIGDKPDAYGPIWVRNQTTSYCKASAFNRELSCILSLRLFYSDCHDVGLLDRRVIAPQRMVQFVDEGSALVRTLTLPNTLFGVVFSHMYVCVVAIAM